MTTKKSAEPSGKGKADVDKTATGFTDEERAAMQERARELKAESRRGSKKDGEADLLAKIAEMPESDRAMATRIHAIVKATAPGLASKLQRTLTLEDGRLV